jgi:hypothetical protein
MNTTQLSTRPEVPELVRAFVARVRECLSDLPADELQDLTEGLEADLTDLVTERGGEALGDPDEYAQELRAAAGLGPAPRRGLRIGRGLTLGERLDRYAAWWRRQMDHRYLDQAWTVAVALRPAWWVARGWVAAVLVCLVLPGYDVWGYTVLPGVNQELGLAVLVACVVGSTLVGLGRLWPGSGDDRSRGTGARVVLVALNVFAILMLPMAQDQVREAKWRQVEDSTGFDQQGWVRSMGVVNHGRQVCNISAYDAHGQPLVGVQLFDQDGQPISTRCWSQVARRVPWMLGDVPRWNVYPLAVRDHAARTPEERADVTGAQFPVPDRATTPEVTNPVVTALAEQRAEAKAQKRAERRQERQEERRAARR